jgi:hypothetical protein
LLLRANDLRFDARSAVSGLVRRQAQAAMRTHLEGCGFPYLCTDSVDVAIEWLKDAGILRGGFTVQ